LIITQNVYCSVSFPGDIGLATSLPHRTKINAVLSVVPQLKDTSKF